MLARLRPVLRGLAGSRSVRKDKQKMCICSSKQTPAVGQGSWLGLAMRSCRQRPISIGLLHDGLASLLLCLFFWFVYFFLKKKTYSNILDFDFFPSFCALLSALECDQPPKSEFIYVFV